MFGYRANTFVEANSVQFPHSEVPDQATRSEFQTHPGPVMDANDEVVWITLKGGPTEKRDFAIVIAKFDPKFAVSLPFKLLIPRPYSLFYFSKLISGIAVSSPVTDITFYRKNGSY
ncbi:hypothetical protein VZ94_21560 [Methylocucumis oryzae]|uniref:Uncharacterized protein n=1 Tax=Methylocucumis oryzae TaxID=1632867 RepID=A0A0F3IHN7_9GAMM|nr:hypothetical protein VZ94_21560 [Methylocucumis oryzae]